MEEGGVEGCKGGGIQLEINGVFCKDTVLETDMSNGISAPD